MSDPRLEGMEAVIAGSSEPTAPAESINGGEGAPVRTAPQPAPQPRTEPPTIYGIQIIKGEAIVLSNVGQVTLRKGEKKTVLKIALKAFSRMLDDVLEQVSKGSAKRGRGRPRKAKAPADPNAPKRPRGRPRKQSPAETPSTPETPAA